MNESEEDVKSVVQLRSPKIGSAPDSLYVTDNHLLFGVHKVKIENIESIEFIEDDLVDWRAMAVIAINTLTGTILAYTLPVELFTSSLIIISAALLGFGIVQLVKNEPVAMVSLKTKEKEFKFGVDNQLDMATLFATVKGELNEQITRDKIGSRQTGSLEEELEN